VGRVANIQLKTKHDGDVAMVEADSPQLLQVFLHIITNAIDAMEESSSGVFEISTSSSADQLKIEFADNGSGIRDPQRVFDPFYTTKPVGKGTGLGLSTCYGIVRRHGGEITCHNRPGGGAVFTLRLPIAKIGSKVEVHV
jgi:two-component system NtrC family sensor kinase